eukprot:gene11-4262_t
MKMFSKKFLRTNKSLLRFITKKNFQNIAPKDINYFSSFLDENSQILTEDLKQYNTDWLHQYEGKSKLVLRPKTTEEVSKIMKHCYENNIAVVPQGGNTGLVGGSVPVFDEIILSTSLMNKVQEFDEKNGTLSCQSGCILENLSLFLQDKGYIMPIDLGAKGSCQIGGNLATAAGGLRFLRYKSLHSNILGLKVVLSDGRILDNTKKVRKDNTGYHLDHLFIGSEGTLGIITELVMQVPNKPKAVNVALLGIESFEKCVEIFKFTKEKITSILSAFEFFDEACLSSVLKNMKASYPLEKKYPFYVLIETHGFSEQNDEELLLEYFDEILGSEIAKDGVLAQDETQFQNIWKLREFITESLTKDGAVYKYDISIPQSEMYNVVEDFRQKLIDTPLKVYGFGHMGDDNLHLNFVDESNFKKNTETLNLIEPYVYEWTKKNNGSISAEHGLGVLKNNFLSYSKDENTIGMMKKMKEIFDPKGILNPYKVLPDLKNE